MTNSITPPLSDQQREARGVLGFIKTLGTATEHLFRLNMRQGGGPGDTLPPGATPAQMLAHVQAREAEIAHLTAVLQNIREGVILQDMEGRIIMMNRAANSLLGTQKAFWDSDLARLFEQARDLQTLQAEFELVGAPARLEINNRILGAQVAAVADRHGQRLGTMIVLQDITREALAERLKDDFITQVSHELRTPLTAIKGMSDVLLSQPPDRPPNRRFLEAIGRNVDVLDNMIVELLDISEITSGTFEVRTDDLELDDLVWSVVRGKQPQWERAKLEVHVITLGRQRARVLGDNRRLRWAFGHLLKNAIQYTPSGGTITLKVGEIKHNAVLVHVEDTGVGISDLDLPHVFNRFYRGEAKTQSGKAVDPRGLGQGLFVARAVAEAHGGYLSVASKPGVGSIFTVALPLPDTRADTQPSLPPPLPEDNPTQHNH